MADPRTSVPKQYRLLAGHPVLTHTLNALGNHPRISHMVTVMHPDDIGLYDEAVSVASETWSHKLVQAVFGGETRQESVHAGLKALSATSCDYVLIHDAARPFLIHDVIDRVLDKLDGGAEGALAATQVVDTLKKQIEPGQPLETIDRENLWAAQTPQAFSLSRISRAHENAAQAAHTAFPDDTSLAEWDGMTVVLSAGDPANFKITTAADLRRAEQQASLLTMSQPHSTDRPLSELTDIRTGIGYDVHAFDDGDAVILGGVSLPHTQKLKGHSDADVVLHAITDATLGAIGAGDIGQHFPPTNPLWKGASSAMFQEDAMRRLSDMGGRLAHIDVTIVCEEPKIGPHRDRIRTSIAEICRLPLSRVSVKATTSERLGFTGRKEGIAALASVTVRLPFEEYEGDAT
ncbi:2-C-methyl-D-erythritol 4-phosphate cytidylyltransferase [Labrenzia sp. OB1]|nr:2-C-methyl-D-erythritol 4-phosphate cytidylyltransferase [Labrenzia sp. OB1]